MKLLGNYGIIAHYYPLYYTLLLHDLYPVQEITLGLLEAFSKQFVVQLEDIAVPVSKHATIPAVFESDMVSLSQTCFS